MGKQFKLAPLRGNQSRAFRVRIFIGRIRLSGLIPKGLLS